MKDNGGNRLVKNHRDKLTNNPTSVTNRNEADTQAAMRVKIERENNDDDADDNVVLFRQINEVSKKRRVCGKRSMERDPLKEDRSGEKNFRITAF